MSRRSAEEGLNEFVTIDDLPLDQDQKEMVLEWFAQKIWRGFTDDFHSKRYDPLIIDGITAHTYVFDLEDGGRHHPFDSLKHLERMLEDEMRNFGFFRATELADSVRVVIEKYEGTKVEDLPECIPQLMAAYWFYRDSLNELIERLKEEKVV